MAFAIRQTCRGFIVLSAEKFHFSADAAALRMVLGVSILRRLRRPSIVRG
jgi:hypothetical protein